MKKLAERLIWARTHKGMSQEQLASNAGVSQSTIGNLEAGIRHTARKIASIANVLGVDAMWLAEGVGTAYPTGAQANQNPPILSLVEKSSPPQISFDTAELAKLIDLYVKSTDHGRMQIIEHAEKVEKLPVSRTAVASND